MTATANMILTLLPIAEKVIFSVGGKLIEMNTEGIKSKDDLIKAIEASKSDKWPVLKFQTPNGG